MKRHLIAASIILSLAAYFLPVAFAVDAPGPAPVEEPEAEPAVPEEETEFSYGTVKSITADQLVVSEYDYDSDQDVDVTYSVPAEVKLEGVASLNDIAAGDAVDIDFLVKGDQKVASVITIEKPVSENGEALDLGADEAESEE
ncbi:MAG: hypothetical protein HY585_04165 [Candidatus Omnitrophica bacterium]|nr:hypothetical protein [Candidatus Omnitrophota bacterium]